MGESNLSPHLITRFSEQREPFSRRFAAVFQQGLAGGEFAFDMPVARLIYYFTSTLRTMLNEVVVLGYYNDDFYYDWIRFFLDSITPKQNLGGCNETCDHSGGNTA